MQLSKRIVCLANSRKLGGRCIAGLELIDNRVGSWLRPISDRPHEEVSSTELLFADGGSPGVMDVVDIPLLEARPRSFQQENWLLDPGRNANRVGTLGWDGLAVLADRPVRLWVNGHSTYHGIHDHIPLSVAQSLNSSLCLIYVDGLRLEVFAPSANFGNPAQRVYAQFSYGGSSYRLRVTDSVYEDRYLPFANSRHQLGECFLTISLGEPFNDFVYKLIAAVVEKHVVDPGAVTR